MPESRRTRTKPGNADRRKEKAPSTTTVTGSVQHSVDGKQIEPPASEIEGIPSTAAIGGHPLHPILIPLPITLLLLPFFTDLGYWQTGDEFWARAGVWLLGAGVLTGLAAGVVGAIDYFTIERARSVTVGPLHAAGNVAALILGTINWWMRLDNPATAIVPWGIVISGVIALLLLVAGWAGGELVYRHKIAVVGRRK
jgi:uncharacterized membrane protein